MVGDGWQPYNSVPPITVSHQLQCPTNYSVQLSPKSTADTRPPASTVATSHYRQGPAIKCGALVVAAIVFERKNEY